MSNDVRILLPIMVAIMLAKFVADAATHSLYHGLLEVKCVPFLPKDVSGAGPSLVRASLRSFSAHSLCAAGGQACGGVSSGSS